MDPTSMGRQSEAEAEDADSSATLEGALEEDSAVGNRDEDADSSATTAQDEL
jgi:hypothetical protein